MDAILFRRIYDRLQRKFSEAFANEDYVGMEQLRNAYERIMGYGRRHNLITWF